jgi:hypothetical protein
MALRPGSLFDISSHFMLPPLSSIMSASSSGVHLDCLLAGDAAGCGSLGGGRFVASLRGDGKARGSVFAER